MMGKLPLGVVSPYVKMSSGGCTDPLKFYATSYCTAYGEGTLCRSHPQGMGQDGDSLLDLGGWGQSMLALPGKPRSLFSHPADPQSCLPASRLAGREDFKPRVGSHEGTGYKSNYRPVVSYQPHLGALDNPAMGYSLSNPSSPSAFPGLSPQDHRTSPDQLQPLRLGSGVLGDSGTGPQPGTQRQEDS